MELSTIKTGRDPKNVHPLNKNVKILADKNPEKIGSILLTEELPQAANVGFAIGTVLEVGPYVKEDIGDIDLVGKRVVFRRFMKDAISFREKVSDKQVFLLHVGDVYLVLEDDTIEIGVF